MMLRDTTATKVRELLGILMESPLYFDMPLAERYELLQHMLQKL